MAKRRRFDGRHLRAGARWTIGVRVSADCDCVTGALVASTGAGLQMRPEIADVATLDVSRDTTELFRQMTSPGVQPANSDVAGQVTTLSARLAEAEALVVSHLLTGAGITPAELLAVGVDDPGLWSGGTSGSGGYLGLCDAARLAELTDANVIDAFPARDVARGGQGGPITALAEWILLRHTKRSRVLLELGHSTRISYLPPAGDRKAVSRILSFHVGPGMRMLDQLVRRLTGGEHAYDPGGRMAVQGHRIRQIEEHWLADPYFRRPLPRWQPRGARPERFLLDAMRMAVDSGWSVRDLLCTATHFIAESVALAIGRFLPRGAAVDEIILSGGGQHNGLLLQEIATRLPDVPLARITQFGTSGEALPPASVALLALLHVDQVPANHSAITGTESPRVLGRLTPGAPKSWQRLLAELTNNRRSARFLRAAS